jgi:4-carboxymuconolactone decarboxylase
MKPLEPENWPDELEEVRLFLGKPLNVHNIMAHHPELMKAWMPFRNHVVANSTLSARQRELLILRTAHNSQADYEWQHHVERGLLAGLEQVEIDRVRQGANANGWQADEAALLAAADDCHRNLCIAEKTLHDICQHFSEQQQLDIVVTVGMYMTLAMIIKTWDVPMEEDPV